MSQPIKIKLCRFQVLLMFCLSAFVRPIRRVSQFSSRWEMLWTILISECLLSESRSFHTYCLNKLWRLLYPLPDVQTKWVNLILGYSCLRYVASKDPQKNLKKNMVVTVFKEKIFKATVLAFPKYQFQNWETLLNTFINSRQVIPLVLPLFPFIACPSFSPENVPKSFNHNHKYSASWLFRFTDGWWMSGKTAQV